MLFEVRFGKDDDGREGFLVRHTLTQNDVMGNAGPLKTKEQAEMYAMLFETSAFIWQFTDPKHLTLLNDEKEIFNFVDEARAIAEQLA